MSNFLKLDVEFFECAFSGRGITQGVESLCGKIDRCEKGTGFVIYFEKPGLLPVPLMKESGIVSWKDWDVIVLHRMIHVVDIHGSGNIKGAAPFTNLPFEHPELIAAIEERYDLAYASMRGHVQGISSDTIDDWERCF